ncbi:hypothetical protein LQ567_16420 [Niabella pedocola]|uniref:Four helix bundle protein n=1 Tax=Niabella pedocola TaxID=1752077 RepID=A0ABS8PTF7_9BACT|nr:hypothetical protein [Niabella pedocola]MCD2424366.1 hypothetical protein [Niabella pedocola]
MENKDNRSHQGNEASFLFLTEEEVNSQECYRHFTAEQKAELIAFVYELSLAIYHLYSKAHEQY